MALLSTGACADDGSDADAADDAAAGKADDPNDGNDAEDLSRLTAIDTAFLLPAPFKGGAANPDISVADRGDKGVLLPNKDYFEVIHTQGDINATKGKGIPKNTYESLYVTSFRYDPCAPSAYHGAFTTKSAVTECGEVIRLVVQPWIKEERKFANSGLHVFYPLDAETGKSIRADLIKAAKACKATDRSGDTQLPIGPHPCLEGDGGSAFLEEHIRPLFAKYLGASVLAGSAQFAHIIDEGEPFFRWRIFLTSPKAIDGRPGFFQAMPLPNLEGGSESTLQVNAVAEGRAREPSDFLSPDDIFAPHGAAISRLHGERGTAGGEIEAATATLGTLAQYIGRWTKISEDQSREAASQALAEDINAAIKALANDSDDPKGDVFLGVVAAYLAENQRLSPQPELGPFFAAGAPEGLFEGPACATCHIQTPFLAYMESIGLVSALRGAGVGTDPAVPDVELLTFHRDSTGRLEQLGTPADGHLEAARQTYIESVKASAAGKGDLAVINFGYHGDQIAVNRRTSNEAIDVAEYLNTGQLANKRPRSGGPCMISVECAEGDMCVPNADSAEVMGTCQPAPAACKRVCDIGKACGNACIAQGKECSEPAGTACNASDMN